MVLHRIVSSSVQAVTIYGSPILTIIDNTRYTYHLRYGPAIEGNAHMIVGERVNFLVPTTFLPSILK